MITVYYYISEGGELTLYKYEADLDKWWVLDVYGFWAVRKEGKPDLYGELRHY